MPTKILEKPSRRRITSIYAFNVSLSELTTRHVVFASSQPHPRGRAHDKTHSELSFILLITKTERNGRKTLTTVQGLPKKFDQKKILKVIKKKFGASPRPMPAGRPLPLTACRIACNGTIVTDTEMGEVIQLQGDQRKDVQDFLTDKEGLELDVKTIKVHGF